MPTPMVFVNSWVIDGLMSNHVRPLMTHWYFSAVKKQRWRLPLPQQVLVPLRKKRRKMSLSSTNWALWLGRRKLKKVCMHQNQIVPDLCGEGLVFHSLKLGIVVY